MASLHRNSLTDERMTARPSPDLQSSLEKWTVRKRKMKQTNKHAGQTWNTEFSRILSAAVPKLRRSCGGFRASAVNRSLKTQTNLLTCWCTGPECVLVHHPADLPSNQTGTGGQAFNYLKDFCYCSKPWWNDPWADLMTSVSVCEWLGPHHQTGTAGITQELLWLSHSHVQVQDAFNDILLKQVTWVPLLKIYVRGLR